MPVFIIGTYDKDGNPNAMTCAWGGISEDHEITLCIDNTQKTADNLPESGAFTVSVGDMKHMKECDYLGIISGKKEKDKIKKAGLTVSKSENVNAPIINEL